MLGRTKWFNDVKGFGFVETEQGDVFIHVTLLKKCGLKKLNEGDAVEIEVESHAKGLRAKSISLVKDSK